MVDAALGCIVGGAIGDAVGSSFEGTEGSPGPLLLDGTGWRLTDDTQLTLATCESIIEQGAPLPAEIATSFVRWYRAGRLTGLGASTLKALRDLDAGAHWALAGRKGERAAGNGAAMRIAPLAFCIDPLSDEGRRTVRDVCRITHHSDEAYVGALAVVLAIGAARRGGMGLAQVASHLPETSVRERLLAYAALPEGEDVAVAGRRFGASGYVIESVPLALYAAGQVGRLGFVGVLEAVIAAGGDTDTNASIACQVAGASLGLGGIPAELVNCLPGAESVLKAAGAFAGVVAHQLRSVPV